MHLLSHVTKELKKSLRSIEKNRFRVYDLLSLSIVLGGKDFGLAKL